MSITPVPAAFRADRLDRLDRLAEAIGLTLPAAYRKDADKHRSLLKRTRFAIDIPTGPTITEALIAALEDDGDPLTDPRVTMALNASRLADQRATIAKQLASREAPLIAKHATAIAKALTGPVTEAYASITAAAQVAPDLGPGAAAERVLAKPSEVAAAWAAARDAQGRLKPVLSLLTLIGAQVGNQHAHLLHLEPGTYSHNSRRSEWDAALAGHTLSWCGGPDGLKDRIARQAALAEEARAQAAAHATRPNEGAKAIADGWARRVGVAQ